MPARPKSAPFRQRNSRVTPAFTLVEMLVVISIIITLLGTVLVVGSGLLTSARIRNTQALLTVVDSAIDEFARQKPSILRARQNKAGGGRVRYTDRYGSFPPDELEMFTVEGLPGSGPMPPNRSLSVGRAEFRPAPAAAGNYSPMLFYTGGNPQPELENRDLLAMLLAIEMYSPEAAMLISKLPGSSRRMGPLAPGGDPLQFLKDPNDPILVWNPLLDTQVPLLIIDSWGQPLSYMAQRDYTGTPSDIPSNNANNLFANWNKASTEMIRLNNGRPIIMSWGPDGKDQLTKEAQTDPTASMVGDWDFNNKIVNTFNEDNVYLDDNFRKKLAERPEPAP